MKELHNEKMENSSLQHQVLSWKYECEFRRSIAPYAHFRPLGIQTVPDGWRGWLKWTGGNEVFK